MNKQNVSHKKTGWSDAEEKLLISEANSAFEKGISLLSVFKCVALLTGRQPMSVRNHYYANVKSRCGHSDFRSPSFVPFEENEVHELIKEMLIAQAKGESVRSCAFRLADNDNVKMLRYQNKYRNVVKSNKPLVQIIMKELELSGNAYFDPYSSPSHRSAAHLFNTQKAELTISELLIEENIRLKEEISLLKERLDKAEEKYENVHSMFSSLLNASKDFILAEQRGEADLGRRIGDIKKAVENISI